MRSVYLIVAALLLALIAQGCGLKGPLRLPDRAKPTSDQSQSAPASTTERTP